MRALHRSVLITCAIGLVAVLMVACGPGAPAASFTAAPLSGDAPLTVKFTDASENEPTEWLWDFGDGSVTSEQNPVHTYAAPGSYHVRLTATNEDGSSAATISQSIEVGPWPRCARPALLERESRSPSVNSRLLQALAWDEFGNEIASPEVAWSAPAGTIDASGQLTAGTAAGDLRRRRYRPSLPRRFDSDGDGIDRRHPRLQ